VIGNDLFLVSSKMLDFVLFYHLFKNECLGGNLLLFELIFIRVNELLLLAILSDWDTVSKDAKTIAAPEQGVCHEIVTHLLTETEIELYHIRGQVEHPVAQQMTSEMLQCPLLSTVLLAVDTTLREGELTRREPLGVDDQGSDVQPVVHMEYSYRNFKRPPLPVLARSRSCGSRLLRLLRRSRSDCLTRSKDFFVHVSNLASRMGEMA
jgi:hypothetical protein